VADLAGDSANRGGIEALETADDVTVVCCPDLMAAYEEGIIDRDAVKAVQLAMIAHCEKMGDRMAILDSLPDLSVLEVKKWRQETNYDSKFAALYYPWLLVAGPDGSPLRMPPSGHVAGIWCRNDLLRGVRKSPANEIVRGALRPSTFVTRGEHDVLNPIGVNVIRHAPGSGVRVWGARTLSSDPACRYIYSRRVVSFVEKLIENGTQWVIFESPSDPSVWLQIEHDVGDLLTLLWRSGVLLGASARNAFFVRCDGELNPPDQRDRGQIHAHVGLALESTDMFCNLRIVYFTG
jgi:phage tail sheath protein FI